MKRLAFLTVIAFVLFGHYPCRAQASDATRGAGWIFSGLGDRATFALSVAVQSDGALRGHLRFIDRSVGLTVESTSITSFTPGCTSTLSGTADSSFGPVNFTVAVTDNGEPGSSDTFTIEVTGSITYTVAGVLGGGNIQASGCE